MRNTVDAVTAWPPFGLAKTHDCTMAPTQPSKPSSRGRRLFTTTLLAWPAASTVTVAITMPVASGMRVSISVAALDGVEILVGDRLTSEEVRRSPARMRVPSTSTTGMPPGTSTIIIPPQPSAVVAGVISAPARASAAAVMASGDLDLDGHLRDSVML